MIAKPSKIFVLSLGLLIVIAIVFWTTSRYPALTEKAGMGASLHLEDALGFEALVPVDRDASFTVRVLATTLNWVDTNRQGMTFGVLFAAAFLTVLPFLRTRTFRGGFANALLGTLMGTPLGVCVNCSAPIARALHASGMRIETTLALMVSSPTLNVVVLTMLFSLFPLYLAVTKLAFTFLFLFLAVPLLSRFVPFRESAAGLPDTDGPAGPDPWIVDPPASDTGWRGSLAWTAKAYLRNLWFIVKVTVPLMLLAGFLGAVAITVFPWERLADLGYLSSRPLLLVQMFAVSAFGLFLPCPIAFDVVISSALLSAGVPVRYVMPLLFTLGSFSVYSFAILWTGVSRRAAVIVPAVLLIMAVASGVLAHKFQKVERARVQAEVLGAFARLDAAPRLPSAASFKAGAPDAPLVDRLQRQAMVFAPVRTDAVDVRVSRASLAVAAPPAGGHAFRRVEDADAGLDMPPTFSGFDIVEPFNFSAGIAAGDVHNDGWPDIVVPVQGALLLYANDHGRGFVRQALPLPQAEGWLALSAALVDIDDDGWLDIYVSTYGQGNYWIANRAGRFSGDGVQRLPSGGVVLSAASGFADLDRDGRLDVVLGNWFGRFETLPPTDEAGNAILWNEAGGWRREALSGAAGETLSTLVSDIDGNGRLDLIVGNDLQAADVVYMAASDGRLEEAARRDGLIETTTKYTMSVDSADIDNDLDLETYFAQIAPGDVQGWTGTGTVTPRESCADVADVAHRRNCEGIATLLEFGSRSLLRQGQGQAIGDCLRLDASLRLACVANALYTHALVFAKDPALCESFPPGLERYRDLCRRAGGNPNNKFAEGAADTTGIPQTLFYNVLLERDAGGRFVDRASARGLHVTAWSWNARFADLDQDGWQDLFVVNGWLGMPTWESNQFFRNQAGQRFETSTDAAGLRDPLPTSAYVYLDVDNDGDLDIVTRPILGPLRLYRNEMATGNAFTVEVRDHAGNRFGVGSTVVIHYEGGRHQMREVKASGGFQSFDPPIVHFGLGEVGVVDRVEVRWSTGERSEIAGPFEAPGRYRIERPAPAAG